MYISLTDTLPYLPSVLVQSAVCAVTEILNLLGLLLMHQASVLCAMTPKFRPPRSLEVEVFDAPVESRLAKALGTHNLHLVALEHLPYDNRRLRFHQLWVVSVLNAAQSLFCEYLNTGRQMQLADV